jgi:serine/threonine-protein kinase HipA
VPEWRIEAIGGKPVPVDIRPRALSTAIDMEDPTASIELALGTADYCGLKRDNAKNIALQVARAVANWRGEAAKLGVSAREIDRMASAFEHEDARKALALAALG